MNYIGHPMIVKIPKKLLKQLEKIAIKTHHSKNYYICKALVQYFKNNEDYFLAIARLKEKNPRILYEKIRKELNLED